MNTGLVYFAVIIVTLIVTVLVGMTPTE